ncbi:MAG: 4Fe-4S ferredoxin [Deltaproteobacteria bacterium]|nr:MAG: 4Fe-4S ferredoxin [Deltaproteobacteria bacterium]
MDESRRNFLKVAGSAAVGAAWAVPVVKALAGGGKTQTWPGGRAARRWALVIDVNKCSSPAVQRACAEACHRVHNVPHVPEHKHEVKWIWSTGFENAFPEQAHHDYRRDLLENPVMVLCNHCERPPCVRVCPTQATFKRPDGVVMMDMHRCIGCRYCIAACPYGARSFNWEDPLKYLDHPRPDYPHRTKGVVEKCTFCTERLARGLEPACVEAAVRVAGPGAMVFGDVGDPNSAVSQLLRTKTTLRRKPGLGTEPHVFYVV